MLQFVPVKGKTPVLSTASRIAFLEALEERLARLEAASQWWKEWKDSRRLKSSEPEADIQTQRIPSSDHRDRT